MARAAPATARTRFQVLSWVYFPCHEVVTLSLSTALPFSVLVFVPVSAYSLLCSGNYIPSKFTLPLLCAALLTH